MANSPCCCKEQIRLSVSNPISECNISIFVDLVRYLLWFIYLCFVLNHPIFFIYSHFEIKFQDNTYSVLSVCIIRDWLKIGLDEFFLSTTQAWRKTRLTLSRGVFCQYLHESEGEMSQGLCPTNDHHLLIIHSRDCTHRKLFIYLIRRTNTAQKPIYNGQFRFDNIWKGRFERYYTGKVFKS